MVGNSVFLTMGNFSFHSLGHSVFHPLANYGFRSLGNSNFHSLRNSAYRFQLHTDCRLSSKQVTLRLLRALPTTARFDNVWNPFRCVISGSLALIFSPHT